MIKIPLRKESTIYILSLAIITLIFYILLPLLAIIPFILLLFVIYSFRGPERNILFNEKVLLSPADGNEIIIPVNVQIKVKKGDTVRGGVTVIGVVK